MTENKRFTIHLDRLNPYKWNVFDRDKFVCQNDYKKGAENIRDLLNELHEENRLLQMKYDAQRELYGQLNSDYNNLREENQELKKDRWICLDCEYQGYSEIGCLCEKKEGWVEHKTECDNFKEYKV